LSISQSAALLIWAAYFASPASVMVQPDLENGGVRVSE
jgi:hypothetical protein